MLKDWRRIFKISLSTVTQPEGCFKYCPLWKRPYIPLFSPPKQTTIQPSQTQNAGNLKKARAKGQQGPGCTKQEIPIFSNKCFPCIKHLTMQLSCEPLSTTRTHFHKACHFVWQTPSQKGKTIWIIPVFLGWKGVYVECAITFTWFSGNHYESSKCHFVVFPLRTT